MSDETLIQPDFAAEAFDDCAPTERDPSRPTRGVALSVLWWVEEAEHVHHLQEGGSAS